MRVLVVDQDSALLTAITQSLGRYFAIDAVTTKADCLDLLRANEFEVVVAGERLEDGSGLELLGQLGKHRPGMLRIFAAERERLKLLKGRLGPFGLFRTLSYPIEARQLLAALSAAGAPDDAADDMADIQQGDGREESPPAPVRSAAPTQRAMSPSSQSRSAAYGVTPPSRQALPQVARTPDRKVRTAQAPSVSESDMAGATQKATATSAQPRPTGPQSARRSGRTSGEPASRLRAAARSGRDSLSEASRMAMAARSRQPRLTEDTGSKRSAFLVGAGVVVVLGVMEIAFKLFNPSDESSTAATGVSVVRTPHYSAEVIKLVAETETANGSNTLSAARASTNTAMAGQGTQPAPASAHTPAFVEAKRPAPAPAATAATAASAPGSSSHGTFAGKTLEDSNGGIISQQSLTPSQATAISAPRSDAPPPVTRDARLVKHVSAEYPPSAANRGIEGVVDVAFTVSNDGSVSDVTVVHSDPPDVFNHSAITAVRRWKYEPKAVNGVPVEAHVQLRLQFKMDQHEP